MPESCDESAGIGLDPFLADSPLTGRQRCGVLTAIVDLDPYRRHALLLALRSWLGDSREPIADGTLWRLLGELRSLQSPPGHLARRARW